MAEDHGALGRFWASTRIGYMEWHEGTPYDLSALGEMTAEERELVVESLLQNTQGWREVQAYGAIATPRARTALLRALDADSDTRLHAAATLRELGEAIDLEQILVSELQRVTIGAGMTTALRLVDLAPTTDVKLTLLNESLRRPDVGAHFAAKLCLLTGVTSVDSDMKMRPFFLRFGEHSSRSDRQMAFDELCQMTNLRPVLPVIGEARMAALPRWVRNIQTRVIHLLSRFRARSQKGR